MNTFLVFYSFRAFFLYFSDIHCRFYLVKKLSSRYSVKYQLSYLSHLSPASLATTSVLPSLLTAIQAEVLPMCTPNVVLMILKRFTYKILVKTRAYITFMKYSSSKYTCMFHIHNKIITIGNKIPC